MSLPFMLFAASPIATGADLRALFDYRDYPESAIRRGEQGFVVPQIIVNPSGHMESCTIIISSRYSDLDSTTCAVLRARAKFAPPKGPENQPVYQVYRTVISYSFDRPVSVELKPDFELTLNRAPTGVSLPFELTIDFLRKANGSVQWCRVPPKWGNVNPTLAVLACSAMEGSATHVIRNVRGEAVDAMDSAKVRFSLDKR